MEDHCMGMPFYVGIDGWITWNSLMFWISCFNKFVLLKPKSRQVSKPSLIGLIQMDLKLAPS